MTDPTIPLPTEADKARDLAADWATCQAATPAPWERFDHNINDYHASTEIRGNPIFAYGKKVGSASVCRLSSGFVWFEGDCNFIPAARTGWEAALRLLHAERQARQAAETDVQRLRGIEADAAAMRRAFYAATEGYAEAARKGPQAVAALWATLCEAVRDTRAGLELEAELATSTRSV